MSTQPTGQATTTRKTFSRETEVSLLIESDPAVMWTLLTNAPDLPRWNSTITRVDGTIAPGQTIRLVSTLDPSRTFKLKITTFEPEHKMAWADGVAPFFRGVRTYTLAPQEGSFTLFRMHEKMGGLMFPMAARQIPDFGSSFEQFARDLKKEAETIAQEQ